MFHQKIISITYIHVWKMGKKRHFKGSNRVGDKKRRQEKEAEWRATRGDDGRANQRIVTENIQFEAFYKALKYFNPYFDF